jgi:hypothetical protein
VKLINHIPSFSSPPFPLLFSHVTHPPQAVPRYTVLPFTSVAKLMFGGVSQYNKRGVVMTKVKYIHSWDTFEK